MRPYLCPPRSRVCAKPGLTPPRDRSQRDRGPRQPRSLGAEPDVGRGHRLSWSMFSVPGAGDRTLSPVNSKYSALRRVTNHQAGVFF